MNIASVRGIYSVKHHCCAVDFCVIYGNIAPPGKHYNLTFPAACSLPGGHVVGRDFFDEYWVFG